MTTPGPITLWSGWDVRGGASAKPDAAETFIRSAPPDPDAGAHYELIAVAARGFRPPRFLSTVPLTGDGGTGVPVGEAPEFEGLRTTWSLEYRFVTETAPSVVAPYGIYLLGVNPPPDVSDDELDTFNDFYTGVHLPEVAERRRALRAVRWELLREIRPPYRGAPHFLAVYEVDGESAANRRHVGPPYTKGPDVWQRHTTPWRLWYRRLVPSPVGGSS